MEKTPQTGNAYLDISTQEESVSTLWSRAYFLHMLRINTILVTEPKGIGCLWALLPHLYILHNYINNNKTNPICMFFSIVTKYDCILHLWTVTGLAQTNQKLSLSCPTSLSPTRSLWIQVQLVHAASRIVRVRTNAKGCRCQLKGAKRTLLWYVEGIRYHATYGIGDARTPQRVKARNHRQGHSWQIVTRNRWDTTSY